MKHDDTQTKLWLEYCARNGLYQDQGQSQQMQNMQALHAQNQINAMNQKNLSSLTNSVNKLKEIFEPQQLSVGIHYKKMSLFDAPKGSILVHACNAQGVWGSGIAKEFKSKFPESFKEYNKYCKDNPPYYSSGTTLITKEENGYNVGCLITSSDFGDKLQAEQTILINTRHALDNLNSKYKNSIFYSNKFNSGYFKVPWEHTEKLIKEFCKKHNKTWIVCEV